MDFSCKVVEELNKLDTPSKLTIIGPKKIPEKYKKLNKKKFISFLDKNNIKNNDLLTNSFLKSHYHLLFSKAEAFGVVFAEASSLGLFNLCFDVEGYLVQ